MTQNPRIVRWDLARAYLELERAMSRQGVQDPQTVRSINTAFDLATARFFRGKLADAIESIQEQTRALVGPKEPTPEWRVGRSLKVEMKPPVFVLRSGDEVVARLSRLYATDPATNEGRPVRIAARLTDAGGLKRDVEIEISPGGDPLNQDVRFRAGTLALGRARLTLEASGQTWEAAFCDVVERSLDALREDFMRRLDTLPSRPALDHATAVCRARCSLLSDDPSQFDATPLLIDVSAHAKQVAREVEELERGRDPYRSVTGDRWSAYRVAGGSVPMRVFVPPSGAPAGVRPPPRALVIALHGAGGNEHLFMDGYGAGMIKRLAAARGFAVVSPRLGLMSGAPEVFDAILEAAEAEFEVDRARVFLVGHSMGGGIACAWAKRRPDRITAVVSIAGIGQFAGAERLPPVLSMSADLDTMILGRRIARDVDRAKEQGLPVEYRAVPDQGHTLVVGRALPDAVQWLLNQRVDPSRRSAATRVSPEPKPTGG